MSEADSRAPGEPGLVRLECASWREFVERYADDLINGGLYVTSSDVFEPLSLLDVHLALPDGSEIPLHARVVHVVSEEQARAGGKTAGVGLELLDLNAERRQQVLQLIEFARWQGAGSDPNASFTRTLLEISPSLPAAEIGQRLSQLPAAGNRAPSGRLRPGESQKDLAALGVDAVRRYSQQRLIATGSDSQTANATAAPGTERRLSKTALTGPLSGTNLPAASSPVSTTDLSAVTPAGPGSTANMSAVSGTVPSTNAALSSDSSSSATAPALTAPVSNTPGKPVDPLQLKLVLTNFAHRHYDAALRVATELLEGSPQDPQLLRWQAMCNARMALGRNDEAAALEHYDRVLSFESQNREAREFVRTHRRTKRLNSIPFGRYFTKKK